MGSRYFRYPVRFLKFLDIFLNAFLHNKNFEREKCSKDMIRKVISNLSNFFAAIRYVKTSLKLFVAMPNSKLPTNF